MCLTVYNFHGSLHVLEYGSLNVHAGLAAVSHA